MARFARPSAPSEPVVGATPEPTHSPEGVDLTLIRWMLTLTPIERLKALQDAIESIRRLRGEAAEG
ncbi:MAG TPA: hypothetical protein VFQ07_16885 [Candidatus Polarisedimenticolia bacterium]|nr:hypothetical protein [Candidatus Polarisedimenticolia bacterium]